MKDAIIVRGARQHNLKGFDVEIPRRSFTVVTGPSGSGKSSLAFDTIYTVESVTDRVVALPDGARFMIAFPQHASAKVRSAVIAENLRAQGFVRLSVDGRVLHLDDVERDGVDLAAAKELLVIVDRLAVAADARGRIADAVGTAASR